MATKKFPSELNNRDVVLPRDILLIHNITTGETEYTSASGLLAAFNISVLGSNTGFSTTTPRVPIEIAKLAASGPDLTVPITKGHLITSVGNNIGLVIGSYSIGGGDYPSYLQARNFGTADIPYRLLLNPLGGTVEVGNGASSGNLLIGGNCSALTFTDRTPFYDGDAIAEIKKIKGNSGLIDHDSLPPFVQVDKIREIFEDKTKTIKGKKIVEQIKVGEEVIKERDLGAMISVLTKAIQQLTNRIEKLEKK